MGRSLVVAWYCAPVPTTGLNAPNICGACGPLRPPMPWLSPLTARLSPMTAINPAIFTRFMIPPLSWVNDFEPSSTSLIKIASCFGR